MLCDSGFVIFCKVYSLYILRRISSYTLRVSKSYFILFAKSKLTPIPGLSSSLIELLKSLKSKSFDCCGFLFFLLPKSDLEDPEDLPREKVDLVLESDFSSSDVD